MELQGLALLLVQMGTVLVVARLVALVTRRVGQPSVVAEIIAGIALGPSFMGWLWPGFTEALFPATSLSTLHLISQVGLVLFMFLIGMELDLRLIRARVLTTLAISHVSLLLPFALGAVAACLLYPAYAPPDVSLLAFVLFLGIAMSVTAFPVLARILAERRLIGSRVGGMALACAAMADVSAWWLLAFVVAVVRAEGMDRVLATWGLTVTFIVAMVCLVRPALRRISARSSNDGTVSDGAIVGILALLVFSSVTTELIGIHAVFGAFLLGALLPREGPWASGLAQRLETIAVVLLMPLFFAYSGLRTQVGLLETSAQWLVAGGLLACATIGKFGGSALAARFAGASWREAGALGALMNTRGLMELIVLNIGMDLGVISPMIFTMLVLMALVTTVATTPILRWVYPNNELVSPEALESDLSSGRERLRRATSLV